HLLSTRRIGPDLSRAGLKFADGWHYAHHWAPEMVVPDSIMPDFPWLYRTAAAPVVEHEGAPALGEAAGLKALFSYRAGAVIPLRPNPDGLAFAESIDGTPQLEVANLPEPYDRLETWKGKTLIVVVPSEELRGLVAYVQKLGTNRGAWRDAFEPQTLSASVMTLPDTEAHAARGKEVYGRRCIGCHGPKGDGNGPAATFLAPRPRDFTLGSFKFRTTPSGSLPTDGDLYRTLTRGVRWTAMPTWHELPEKDRVTVIAYIKTFSSRWREERPEPPIVIGDPPKPAPELLARGKQLYAQAKCHECHGEGGRGDGPSAGALVDDLKFPIRPTDFTRGQFKGGSDVRDIYRTMTTGLDGTPMPSFADSMKDDERWAISYYVLGFAAFSDPLTGTRLTLDPAAKAKLNLPGAAAHGTARLALDPAAPEGGEKTLVRFYKGILGEGR
ncbi:MAG: c-type cytochrome, partial [Candidatus Rokuibacteriota bacterium]